MARSTGVSKFLLSLAVLGILGCLSYRDSKIWEINPKSSPSSSSGYYVLHDWQNTYSKDDNTATAFPALAVSDIMLKTMGILKSDINWPGVLMGNLFSRPHATALFIVDGLSSKSSLGSLPGSSFNVDQTGLTGCTCGDMEKLFSEDNVATHLSDLFDHHSETYSVSANTYAAKTASAREGSYTTDEQLKSMMGTIQNGGSDLFTTYGLDSVSSNLDISNEVDARFLAEVVLVKQAVEQLAELPTYTSDGAPDVFIFTFSTLRSLEVRYGAGSSKVAAATQLVKNTIAEVTKKLVNLYNEKILVQALVLEWDYPEFDKDSEVLSQAYQLLQPYITDNNKEEFLGHLPRINVRQEFHDDYYLCRELRHKLKDSKFSASCAMPPQSSSTSVNLEYHNTRELRDVADQEQPELYEQYCTDITLNKTVSNLAESRSNEFTAVFLITLFIVVSLGASLYAISWAMWTMDPGRDSIIYRQVADPTIQ